MLKQASSFIVGSKRSSTDAGEYAHCAFSPTVSRWHLDECSEGQA